MSAAPESSGPSQPGRSSPAPPDHTGNGHPEPADEGTGTLTDAAAGEQRPRVTGSNRNQAATTEVPAALTRFDGRPVSRFPVGIRVPLPPLPTYAGPPASASAAARPSRPRRHRTLQILAGVLAVLVAVTGIVIVRNSYGPPPRKLVQQLFDRLADRDNSAFYLVGKCSGNPLCEGSALKAGYQPPTNPHIDGERDLPADPLVPGSKRRGVTVSYDLDGRRVTDVVGLTYRKQNFFGGYWSITEPPGTTITVPGPTHFTIAFAGADLPSIAADVPVTAWAPPGVYTVSKAATALMEPARVTVTVATGGTDDTSKPGDTAGDSQSTTVTLPDTIRAGVTEQVTKQIRDGIDACAAQRVFDPDTDPTLGTIHTCTMRHSTKYAITDKPQWTVVQYPQLRFEPAPDGTITVTTTTAGRAAIRYRWAMYFTEPRTWYDVDAVEEFKVTGRVTADNGTPTWTPT